MQQQVNEIFVFFTSKYSNACKQVVEKINYIAPHFNTRIVDIDNPDTRFVIQNATQYKIETSGKYKISKSAFTTIGVLYEKKISTQEGGNTTLGYIPGVYNANKDAYQFVTSVSFWF